MFDNLLLIAVIVIVFWLGIFAFYMMTSKKQEDIQKEIESVEKLLEEDSEKTK
jgi:uncharacterized membrane protein